MCLVYLVLRDCHCLWRCCLRRETDGVFSSESPGTTRKEKDVSSTQASRLVVVLPSCWVSLHRKRSLSNAKTKGWAFAVNPLCWQLLTLLVFLSGEGRMALSVKQLFNYDNQWYCFKWSVLLSKKKMIYFSRSKLTFFFSVEGMIVPKYFGCTDHKVFVTTTQLCHEEKQPYIDFF